MSQDAADVDLLTPPDDEAVNGAIAAFARAVRAAYGDRLKGIYLFGSRARGDHTRDSDADIAVVLADGDWRRWDERRCLVDLPYDSLVSTGAELQPHLVAESEWNDPARHENPLLVEEMREDARAIGPADE